MPRTNELSGAFSTALGKLESAVKKLDVAVANTRHMYVLGAAELAYAAALRCAAAAEQATLLARALPAYTGSPFAAMDVETITAANVPVEIGFTAEGNIQAGDANSVKDINLLTAQRQVDGSQTDGYNQSVRGGNDVKNNLFYYATSELSQDAFLCYMLSFALKGYEDIDSNVRDCARHFVWEMLPDTKGKHIILTDIERQTRHIDVLLTVVCEGKTYKVAVEDKTHTSEHDNQLKNYLAFLRSAYPECVSCGVYYKTGFQSNLSAATQAGYRIITRSRMLEILAPFVMKTCNQIVRDYYEYWYAFERDAQAYVSLPLAKWNRRQVYGYYDALKNSQYPSEWQVEAEYFNVSNKAGGFENFCIWGCNDLVAVCEVKCELYLQLEASCANEGYRFPICLKLKPISADVPAKDVRNALIYDESGRYCLSAYHFLRPARLSAGRHMTVGVYDATYETADELTDALAAAIRDYRRLVDRLQA